MKKVFFVVGFFCLFSIFVSCGGDGGAAGINDNGTAVFVINESVIQKLRGTASKQALVSASVEGLDNATKYTVQASLSLNETSQTKEAEMPKGGQVEIIFEGLAVGSKAKAAVKIFIQGVEYASGESDEITVVQGQNPLKVSAQKCDVHPIVLYNTRAKERKFTLDDPDSSGNRQVKAEDDGSKEYTLGAGLFAYVSENSKISESPSLPLPVENNASAPAFCFEDGKLYWAAQDKINVYSSPDYNLEKTIEAGTLIKKGHSFTSGQELRFQRVAICNGHLFLTVAEATTENNSVIVSPIGFAAINLASTNPQEDAALYTEDNLDVETNGWRAFAVAWEQEDQYTVYYVETNAESTVTDSVRKNTFSINNEGTQDANIQFASPSASGSNYLSLGFDEDNLYDLNVNQMVTDLRLDGKTLYATFCIYRSAGNEVSPLFQKEGESYVKRYPVVSAGGLVKINLDTFEFENWKSGSPYLGLYQDFWYIQGEALDEYAKSGHTGVFAPPESLSGQYFYGAKKILAIKPDELVIADDGLYTEISVGKNNNDGDTPGEIIKCVNKNRAVTINLLTESFSAVDVGVSFDSTANKSTYYGVGD